MSNIVKNHKPVIKDILGLKKALKIESEGLNLEEVTDLYLLVDLDGKEKAFPFEYYEKDNDYRVYQIPTTIPDELILEGQIVTSDKTSDIKH